MLPAATDYQDLQRKFAWAIPERFNIAAAVCDRHADGRHRLALVELDDGLKATEYSFDALSAASNRLANGLRANGLKAGDRIGILLGQRVETLIGHLAIYKLGAIAVPLFSLFGPDALAFRMADSGMRALITDPGGVEKIASIRDQLPELQLVVSTEPTTDAINLDDLMSRASDVFQTMPTLKDDPALIIYTSGTTGPPKGALHAHRVLLGHLPGVQWPHDFFPKPGDRFWTPADWAWIGGLFDVLMPSLYFGVPVVAWRGGKFEAETAIDLMARHDVRNVFLPPTALRLLREAKIETKADRLKLRSLASGGERLGDDVIDWGRSAFGLTINEFYGQTEANLLVGNNAGFACRSVLAAWAVPCPDIGSQSSIRLVNYVLLVSLATLLCAGRIRSCSSAIGIMTVHSSAKFRGDWLLSGDLGVADDDGYFTYLGRTDDMINSAGYRIGPTEIETCLLQHRAIAMAAIVGVPDKIRGEVIKAYIVLRSGFDPSPAMASDIQEFVKSRLAAHQYPRKIEFLTDLPLTATGKVKRGALRTRDLSSSIS